MRNTMFIYTFVRERFVRCTGTSLVIFLLSEVCLVQDVSGVYCTSVFRLSCLRHFSFHISVFILFVQLERKQISAKENGETCEPDDGSRVKFRNVVYIKYQTVEMSKDVML